MNAFRSHTCGALTKKQEGETVTLQGWVHRRRDHGGVIFIDLRDRYGLTQIVFNPEVSPEVHAISESLRSEYVISISGKVVSRPDGMVNSAMSTGEIDVIADALEILSEAKTPPFPLDEKSDVGEMVRLKYRYLDMRRSEMQKNFEIRHKLNHSLREFLNEEKFMEVETPILTKATPEGARDYLVPSRVHPGSFYALPQSPQLFKQLLMISGFDRYFQIARCFRDEDLRSDRQPEFTQLDMEMSFVNPEMIYKLVERMCIKIFKDVLNVDIEGPFPRLSYEEAMEQFASDKPDLRWPIELKNLSSVLKTTDFKVFRSVIEGGGEVRGFGLKGGNELSRSQVDQLVKKAQSYGAKGLVWFRVDSEGKPSSSVEKFLSEDEMKGISQTLELSSGDIGFIIADDKNIARSALHALKLHCVEKMNIPPASKYEFLWVENFPLLEWDDEGARYKAVHHPFTAPHKDDVDKVAESKDLGNVRAQAYDLVLNGFEIGGGSIRIHSSELQAKVFEALKISSEEAEQKFGFFLEALSYGTPPHGGIAFGLDRIAMVLAGTTAIRDVIAFPKTQSATDVMCQAPAEVSKESLQDLSISVRKPVKNNKDD